MTTDVYSSISTVSFVIADIVSLTMTVCTSNFTRKLSRVFSVNIVAVWVLENRGDVLDVMIFIHVRDFTLLFSESDCDLLHFAITLGTNTLHVRTTVSYLAN